MKSLLLILPAVLLFSLAVQGQNRKNPANRTQTFEGIVRTFIFEDKAGTVKPYLDTGEKKIWLAPADENLSGSRVSVTGKLNGENRLISERIEVLSAAKAAPSVAVAGTRKVLVLLLNFQNDTSQPLSAAQIKNHIFLDSRSPNQYFQQVSENQFRLGGSATDGDVFGYYTLPFNVTAACSANQMVNEWAAAADQLAANGGINVNAYQSVIYLFAGNIQNCDVGVFADLGFIGDQTRTERVYFANPFGDFNSRTFQYYIAHELGHNLGLNHVSGFRDCPINLPIEDCGSYEEYADRADLMGYFGYRLLSNYHQLRLGWLTGKTQVFDQPGAYSVNLYSPNNASKRTTLVQIRTKDANGNFTGKSFYLEYRRNALPFDRFESGEFPLPPVETADKGITIRFGSENLQQRLGRFYIIDTTPETPDFGDAALTPGGWYANTYYYINIFSFSTSPLFGARLKIEILR